METLLKEAQTIHLGFNVLLELLDLVLQVVGALGG